MWKMSDIQCMMRHALGIHQSTLVKLMAITIIAAAASYVIYQVYFHPLARFPGPFTCKISGARAIYYGVKGDSHVDILRCHQKYGPTVRYKPNMLIYNNVSGLKDIYSSRKNVRKTRNYRLTDHGIPNILSTADKKAHAARRRMLSSSFSESAVHRFEPQIAYHMRAFCDALYGRRAQNDPHSDAPWGPAIDMSAWSTYLTFDAMTEYIFGKKSHMLSKRKNQAIMPIIERLLDIAGVFFHLPLPFPEILSGGVHRLVNRRHDMFSQYIEDNAQAHRGLSPDQLPRDVFSHLASSRDSHLGRQLTHGELQSECLILSIAGYDTLSTALASAIFYLSRYPHAQARLSDEIRSTFGQAEEISADEVLKKCHYFNACLTESLRISPPVTMCLSREVEEAGEMIDGQFIPRGCVVGSSIYALHRNADYFVHPEIYLPERWLASSGDYSGPSENKGSPAATAYNPFSMGPRACIGRSLAYSELSLSIAHLVWTYDFKPAEGPDSKAGGGNASSRSGRNDPNELQVYDRISTRVKGPMIQFRPRQRGNMV